MSLNDIAITSIIIGIVCSIVIIIDIINGHRQKMGIMNVVWPITTLYSGPIGLWAYFKIGRMSAEKNITKFAEDNSMKQPENKAGINSRNPGWKSITKSTLHCGGGCTLGDLISENILAVFPFTLFGSTLYGSWFIDYFVALAFGIIFQYYALKPMKLLSPKDTLIAAVKADTLSLTSWQIGMYGWMAISVFLIFGHPLSAKTSVFWFMMQIAMIFGFLTAYPMNIFLLKKGIKESM
jgi:Domain of unknown function (DUF4396)